jgi:hypothetical protein
MKRLFPLLTLSLALCTPGPIGAVMILPDDVDHSAFDDILRSYVNAEGLVNYDGLRGSSMDALDAYIALLAKTDLKERDHKQKMAFWINAYNAHAIREILNHPGLEKLSPKMALYSMEFTIAKGRYSLNDIEHRIIRGKVNPDNQAGAIKGVSLDIPDPRIHFSLVNGAIGAPPLRNFAYTAANIEETLRQNSADFANSRKYLRLEKDRLEISNIVNDFAEDFETWGGPAAYLARLVDGKRRPDAELLKQRLTTDYRKANFIYDWSVNDIMRAPTKRPKLMRSHK